MDTIRVLRVLEYVGPRSWVESTFKQNAVKGTREYGSGHIIREATAGDAPEIVRDAKAERLTRQGAVWEWGIRAFGFEQMASLPQRGARFAEEAVELAQAAGVDRDMMHALVEFIYSRPVGELKQELGGVGVTLLALAMCANVEADDCEKTEIARVLAKPIEQFQKRNAEKNAAGFYAIKDKHISGLRGAYICVTCSAPWPEGQKTCPRGCDGYRWFKADRGSTAGLAAQRHVDGIKSTDTVASQFWRNRKDAKDFQAAAKCLTGLKVCECDNCAKSRDDVAEGYYDFNERRHVSGEERSERLHIATAQAALDAAGEPAMDVVEIVRFVPLDELPAPVSPFDVSTIKPVAL